MSDGEIIVTAETEEKALEEVLERLRIDRDGIDFEVSTESEDGLLPGAKPEIEIRARIRPEYILERAKERLGRILELMGMEFEIETTIDERIVRLNVEVGEQSSILIGREGQNLHALQYLINRMVSHGGREAPMIIVDVEDYRQRQYGGLQNLVERAVKRARETGNEIELDAMSPLDRKYLHHYLTRFDGVQTFSRGEEPERYVVIIAD